MVWTGKRSIGLVPFYGGNGHAPLDQERKRRSLLKRSWATPPILRFFSAPDTYTNSIQGQFLNSALCQTGPVGTFPAPHDNAALDAATIPYVSTPVEGRKETAALTSLRRDVPDPASPPGASATCGLYFAAAEGNMVFQLQLNLTW
jgi:hypothetical protein